jgi:hypothetical protein
LPCEFLRGWSFVQLSTSGHTLGLGLVNRIDERSRINPGFDGGLVTAQLGLGIGQSTLGLLKLSISQEITLGVEKSLHGLGAISGVEQGGDPSVERGADSGFAHVDGGWMLGQYG